MKIVVLAEDEVKPRFKVGCDKVCIKPLERVLEVENTKKKGLEDKLGRNKRCASIKHVYTEIDLYFSWM